MWEIIKKKKTLELVGTLYVEHFTLYEIEILS